MKKFLLSSALVFAGTLSANAGSLAEPIVEPVLMPAPVAAPLWEGFYVGALAGMMTGDSTDTGTSTPTVDPFDGYLFGGFAGYNYQMDSGLVIGPEVAVLMGNMDFGTSTLGVTLVDLKARVGYAAGKALVYASGGYTLANYDNGDQGAGWNVGVGVDYLVTDHIFIGGEYVYRDITDTLNTPATWEDQFGTVQARIGVKF